MKVFFVFYAGKREPYNKEIHAKKVEKFIYWSNGGEEVIITGLGGIAHDKLLEAAGDLAPAGKPDGAGRAMDGIIDCWESYKLNVQTPTALFDHIREELGLK